MPLPRFPETPLSPPSGIPPATSPGKPSSLGASPSSPAAPPGARPLSPLAALRVSSPAIPAAAPAPPQLQLAATELTQAAERTERCAREILCRAMELSDQLAKRLDRTERRSAAGGLAMLLSATLLCAASALLSTLVTLALVFPRVTVLDLLRLLLRSS